MDINKNEVLKYLGYKNDIADNKTIAIIEECLHELHEISKPKYIYNIFDIETLGNSINFISTTLTLKGNNICAHLTSSEKCAVMAATLGIEVDKQLLINSSLNLTKAIIMDACATASIESLCETAQLKIKKQAQKLGLCITSRYSPGYGDLSIDVQPQIINVLDAYKKIGLSSTQNCILIPRKSVTAFIGLQNTENKNDKLKCLSCNFKDCSYRRSES